MIDREKVIKGLEFTKAMITFNPSTGEDIEPGNLNEEDKTTYDACVGAIAILKEQEGVVPYIDIDEAKCPVCKVKLTRQELIGDDVLFEDFFDYCPHCGKPVLWEGR